MVFLDELESNVKVVKPVAACVVLIYSLGDEMCKWTRMCSLSQRVEELCHMVGVLAHPEHPDTNNPGPEAWPHLCRGGGQDEKGNPSRRHKG